MSGARAQSLLTSTVRQIMKGSHVDVATAAGDVVGPQDGSGNFVGMTQGDHGRRIEQLLCVAIEVLLDIRDGETNPS